MKTGRTVALSAAAVLVASRGRAQVVFRYDPTTRNTTVAQGAELVERLPNGKYRMKRAGTVRMEVEHTNTAVYKVTFDTGTTAAPMLDTLRAFLTRAKTFFPEIGLAIGGPAMKARGFNGSMDGTVTMGNVLPRLAPSNASAAVRAALASGQALEGELRVIDSLVHGPRGIEHITSLAYRTLERMRRGDATTLANALRDSVGLGGRACEPARAGGDSLPLAQHVMDAIGSLALPTRTLHETLDPPELWADPELRALRDPLVALRASADTILRTEDQLTEAAYRAEGLARTVAGACSHAEGRALSVTRGAGRAIGVKIEPRPEPELARVADRGAGAANVTVLPPLGVVMPSLGLGFLVAPNARYDNYATRTAATGGTEIYVPNTRDARFGWGATLGFTWRGLNGSDHSGVSVWLPELTLGEASSTTAFGVGTAVSYDVVKLGVGALWAKHLDLVDATVGQKIPNDKFLVTREVYGRPTLYLGLSVFEWPPFLTK